MTEQTRDPAQSGAAHDLAVEVDGCFQAAYAEGLSERLAESDQDIGTLADLIFRRLIPAHQAACVVLADEALKTCGAQLHGHSGAVENEKRAEQSNPGGGHEVTERDSQHERTSDKPLPDEPAPAAGGQTEPWPPLKMALWRVLMDENLNDGHYIKAFELIEKLYSAVLSAGRSPAAWECQGRKQALPEPADCNWPDCGCDPHATKVIESLLEQGWCDGTVTRQQYQKEIAQLRAQVETANARLRQLKDSIDTRINDLLCETKPGYDDSVVGINDAWDVVRKACDLYIAMSHSSTMREGE